MPTRVASQVVGLSATVGQMEEPKHGCRLLCQVILAVATRAVTVSLRCKHIPERLTLTLITSART
jgi:hypothetical protein